MVSDLKENGTFLLNCGWTAEELSEKLPADMKRILARRNIKLYTIDGVSIGKEIGLGSRINMIMQAAFFKLANIIPLDDAVTYMKDAIQKTYGRKGEKIVNMNYQAVDRGIQELKRSRSRQTGQMQLMKLQPPVMCLSSSATYSSL